MLSAASLPLRVDSIDAMDELDKAARRHYTECGGGALFGGVGVKDDQCYFFMEGQAAGRIGYEILLRCRLKVAAYGHQISRVSVSQLRR